VLIVDFLWGLISKRRVETFGIIAKFDVSGNIGSGMFPGRVDGAVNPFDFHRGVERFD